MHQSEGAVQARKGVVVLGADELYREAMGLALSARAYAASLVDTPGRGGAAPAWARLAAAGALALVTSRVAYCLAWLLARRAVAAGELSAEEALGEPWRLGGGELPPEVCGGQASELPPELRRLAERSHALFRRVERLDRDLDRAAA